MTEHDRLRRALRDAAGQVEAGRDSLDRLRARKRRDDRVRAGMSAGAAVAAFTVLSVLAIALRSTDTTTSESLSAALGDAVPSSEGLGVVGAADPDASPGAGGGNATTGASRGGAISADGSVVAFVSDDADLVAGDTNDDDDIFVRDLRTGKLTLASRSSAGETGNGASEQPRISADGRFVAFTSDASNLAPGDGNEAADVFVHDLETGSTVRASVANDGDEDDGNEDDGNEADGNEADGPSGTPTIARDGSLVAFTSVATNLVDGDTNGVADVFLRDIARGTTARLSTSALGEQANGPSDWASISPSGSVVAFTTDASNLVLGDGNGTTDVIIRDLTTGTTERATPFGVEPDGESIFPAVAGDDRTVAFLSSASNLVGDDTRRCRGEAGERSCLDAFVHDRITRETRLVSRSSEAVPGNADTFFVSISDDGTTVAFSSDASNLVDGDDNGLRDIFVRRAGSTSLVSASADGGSADGASGGARISGDGTVVAFQSLAGDLVLGDGDRVVDVFIRAVDAPGARLVS